MAFLKPRVIAEVNLSAIRHNYREIRKIIPKEVEIMGVVKADAYGHGAIRVSSILQEEGVDRLAVAIAKEGEELRVSGVTLPILVLGYTPQADIELLIVNDLTQTVFSYEMAEYISMEASKFNKTINVHIKIDTGMGRIGFLPNTNSILEIRKIMNLPHINVEGLFTHFATADEEDRSYTKEQWSVFKGFINELKDFDIEIPLIHASNSGAILSYPHTYLDIVRPGIVLYGHYPSEFLEHKKISLMPSMSLKTQVVHLKELSKDKCVSYGKSFVTTRKTKIATIPIGYADGYPRRLSNKASVLINGEYAKIIGKICMDQFMVDITDIGKVDIGDEVVLFGVQKGKSILVEELASTADTINYELICTIGKRVPRRYID
ncbi:alanine racemase [Candidatus Epulonipiscium viviparus]|uniref:alanine racemase n=1 Tax=Candidatus Epulonipiscium viviparus TaxID=420336 RepID=UPI0027380517|nr:alanine racemase [Candidatus Epulopiscium viviparus]